MTNDWIDRAHKALCGPEAQRFAMHYVKCMLLREQLHIDKHHPLHLGHEKTVIDEEYFDAMFLSRTLSCSCGAQLVMTREMTDRDEEIEKQLPKYQT